MSSKRRNPAKTNRQAPSHPDKSSSTKDSTEHLSESVACLWEDGDREYCVAVVGTGPGFMALLDVAFNPLFRDFIPPVRVIGVARPGPNPAKLDYARERGLPFYETLDELMASQPHVNMVVDLTGEDARLRSVRERFGDRVTILDQDAAIFICGLHDMAKANTSFRDDLDRQRHLLQAIVDEVREDIMLLDLEGRVVDMNRNVWRRTGRSKPELIGKYCWEVLTKRDGKQFCNSLDAKCPLQRSLETRLKDEALFTRVSAGGRLLYYRVYSYPVFDRSGRLSHIMMMHRDITARTHREKHLQQTEKLAAIGEMSTYLAHEIRNPLCAIGGFTQVLLRSPNLSEKEREKVGIIAEETKRLDKLLSGILNFARPVKTPLDEVDVGELASDTVELMQIGYQEMGYRFSLDVEQGVPKIRGGAENIKQCLVNMIKNSMEAMPDGGPIRVSVGLEGDRVRLGVEDQGTGMDEVEQERAFSPFYSTKEGGTGLGLAMIKKLVADMGGSIELRSQPGKGTAIYLLFPPILEVAATPSTPSATPRN